MSEPVDATKNEPLVYSQDKGPVRLSLSEQQKGEIQAITESIVEVDENIRRMAVPDVIHTLENGNPLNRILTDPNGKVTGYIACEDWFPHEGYLKYLGTTRATGRSLFAEIPAFLKFAKTEGYTKLSFHGWNDRLNSILERYDFKHIRDDEMADFKVGFFEKTL
ncbi:MAG: hypothetical protein UU16_C0013G0008 [Candidatus Woesebacteria bacterium GW2011_GWA2_40_7]|uniref:N-acetyltransferase domain-containing protein n=3 Tax=Candidatus Woeseibacteriota TaxID=1752722 RepID=A0A0G0P1H8_9BACT|nr:MAG: hypothetical protein UT17_C0003G0002 [Candidatus Woesebacteria bacterium GW2011_GWB1_39_10]KKR73794.1 MAG: hypothetical protein UU16_C0013G0008 [Candidatus Woesebacteria bacterium GW2011_GWA2_40_7]KKS90939.1 MAG: hypothetical protein UV66_C0001G0296 [Candidatus Woesebacteria bacterium GW2011_GWA1_43_12]